MIFRRRKRRAALKNVDTLIPPEGVPLRLDIAGIGVRLGAQITDILITTVAALALFFLLLSLGALNPASINAVASMLFFIIRIPYYVFSELIWNGQTLGKRLLKIKVVAFDGGSLTAQSLIVRNLMKEAEVFLPGTLLLALDTETPVATLIACVWIAGALAVPLLNKRRRRLGDMIAGTYVVHLPQPILLDDLAEKGPASQQSAFTFLPHQLEHYGAFELQTLEKLLRSEQTANAGRNQQARQKTVKAVVEQIRKKIDYPDPVPPLREIVFLQTFYSAQRAHLEQRQLFGERRADKFHAVADEVDPNERRKN